MGVNIQDDLSNINLHKYGNIPKISSYGVFTSQVLRYAIACQEYQDFKTRSAMLVKKLLRQNYEIVYLKRTLKKFLLKYSGVISDKFGNLGKTIIQDIFRK